eukprot:3373011-Prymnesium_polylepis.1
MEAFLTSVISRNNLEQQIRRCEQNVHTPSRQHHACVVRRVRRRPGILYMHHSMTVLTPSPVGSCPRVRVPR